MPVLDVGSLLDQVAGPPPRQGDGALVLDVEGLVCALRVDQVDHVASLHESTAAGDANVVDAGGRSLILLDPAKLARRALELVGAAPDAAPARPG